MAIGISRSIDGPTQRAFCKMVARWTQQQRQQRKLIVISIVLLHVP